MESYRVERLPWWSTTPSSTAPTLAQTLEAVQQPRPDCIIIGHGAIWAKAENLITYAPHIIASGMYISPMLILADDCFADFKQQELVRDPQAPWKKTIPHLDSYLTCLLKEVHTYFSTYDALLVRSSAGGDSAGTGVRESVFCWNSPEKLEYALKRVLASNQTPEATLFREQAGLDTTFAVIITPIVGNRFEHDYAPAISGYAFTNQFQQGLHINIGPGIWGGIHAPYILPLSAQDVQKFQTAERVQWHALRSLDGGDTHRPPELWTFTDENEWGSVTKDIPDWVVCDADFAHARTHRHDSLLHAGLNEPLQPLLDKITELKWQIWTELYLEFALQKTPEWSKRYINQIAPLTLSSHHIETVPHKNTLAYLNSIITSWKKEIQERVFIPYAGGLHTLYEFNKTHSNYGIIIPDTALSSSEPPHFSTYSNASAILLEVKSNCAMPPIAHLGGASNLAWKMFGVISRSNPRVWFTPKRALTHQTLLHNDNRQEQFNALCPQPLTLWDDYTEIHIFSTPLILEADESRDYGSTLSSIKHIIY
jgi:hypothetical protein